MLEARLHKAEDEWRERVRYDHVVVNDDLVSRGGGDRRILGLRSSTKAVALGAEETSMIQNSCSCAARRWDPQGLRSREQADARRPQGAAVLTRSAAKLVNPQLFEALTSEPAYTDEFASRAEAR